jgi:hypothetical protein
MIPLNIIGGTVSPTALYESTERTVNYFPDSDPRYPNQMILRGFPGLTNLLDIDTFEGRGAVTFKDYMVCVYGQFVYKITEDFAVSQIGLINTSTGLVSMSENGLQLLIVDGQDGWVWDDENWVQVTDAVFILTKADSATYLDSAFLVNKPGTGQFYGSTAGGLGATEWPALKFATAEYKSDNITKLWTDRELILAGPETTQVYWNNGAEPMPFTPMRNGRAIYGIAARDSHAIVNNTSHFLCKDINGGLFVGKMDGTVLRRISSSALNAAWSKYSPEDIASAKGFGIHWHGHEWYVITFEEADHGSGRTFAHDAATNLWFEIGPYSASIGDFVKHPMKFHIFFAGRHLIGDQAGRLRELDEDSFTFDTGQEVISKRIFPAMDQNNERVFHEQLEIEIKPGVGIATGQGSDPELILLISDTRGQTYEARRTDTFGAAGKHTTRCRFEQLGSSYDRVYSVAISDPVERVLVGAYAR